MDRTIQRKQPLSPEQREIFLAAGCFWGGEKFLSGLHGVIATSVGYANCRIPSPTYEQVCAHGTGCAETVHVTYAPGIISLPSLLIYYAKAIDPTAHNRQGGDIGAQYRTGIYYVDDQDLPAIQAFMATLQKAYEKPLAIEVLPLLSYYLAEAYHQEYLIKNPGGYCHISDALCKAAAMASRTTDSRTSR